MREDCFDGSLVYLGACNSITDTRLAESIFNKCARAILGNTKPIGVSYNFEMIYSFFEGLTSLNSDGSYMTVSQALEYAKSKNGANDIEYMKGNMDGYSPYSDPMDEFWSWFFYGSEVRLASIDDFTLPDMLGEDAVEISTRALEETRYALPDILLDYSLYIPAIEKAIEEKPYPGDDYGILYDLDKDGVEELFMLHTYSGSAVPEIGYSIYDISDGVLVTRAEKQTLTVMAGGGGCIAGISETDAGSYFYVYGLQIGDQFANSSITVFDQNFSVYRTFEANMETEGIHITQDPYTTSYSIDGNPCTEAEYKLLLFAMFPFDTDYFQLENAERQNGLFYNGQWYGETLTALLNRLKAPSEQTDQY